MDLSLPINQGIVNKIMNKQVFTPCVYTQTSRVYLTPCMLLYSLRTFHVCTLTLHACTSIYRVHCKKRFERVTRKHMTGFTIVHAWYHA